MSIGISKKLTQKNRADHTASTLCIIMIAVFVNKWIHQPKQLLFHLAIFESDLCKQLPFSQGWKKMDYFSKADSLDTSSDEFGISRLLVASN